MNILTLYVAWLLQFVMGSNEPGEVLFASLSRRTNPIDIVQELGPLLSPGASIIIPSDSSWDNLTARSSFPRVHPSYLAVVEVATEEDVQLTIRFANRHDLPFLAVSGAHGSTTTLNGVHSGIQINMRKMNSLRVNADGNTATVGGGIMQNEITKSLYQYGKQAVTGLCECVSVIGPLLGGGHSFLQGHYGFAADNLVSARLVVADGSVVEVSDKSNSDLFWAIRGAGHNFGIVTSFDLMVHDIPNEGTWTLNSFIFTQESLEEVFDAVDKMDGLNGDHDVRLAIIGLFVRIPDVDAADPVILYQVVFEGSQTAAEEYVAPFSALNPVSHTTQTGIAYLDLYEAIGFGLDNPGCQENDNALALPASLPHWNSTAIRKAFSLFSELTADQRFAGSIFLLENYGMKGVHAVEERSTSVPSEERRNSILTSPVLLWTGDDEEAKQKAYEFGRAMKDALNEGQFTSGAKPHSYVNYASGEESLEEVYGYEPWRLNKLRRLKRAWDPHARFGFYMPIV